MIHEHALLKVHQLYGGNPKSGDIGVELEIEGDNLPTEVPGWVIKHEGSLRGRNGRTTSEGDNAEDAPHEYVTSRPVTFGSSLHNKLTNLHKALTLEHVRVRLTERASTHIHINMTERTVREVIGFLAVFSIIEPVLLRICGTSRNGNLFCLPSYETGDMTNYASRVVSAVLANPTRGWPQKRGKYAALNTDPLTTLGSLEVRSFPNEVNPDVIYKWASWLMNIRTLAICDDETYMGILERAYDEPMWLLREIFGQEQLFAPCYPNNPAQLVTFGIEQAYELLKVTKEILDVQTNPVLKRRLKAPRVARWDTAAIPPDFFGEVEP